MAFVRSICTPSPWLFVTVLGSMIVPSVAPTAVRRMPSPPLLRMLLLLLVTLKPPVAPSKFRRMPSAPLLLIVLSEIRIGAPPAFILTAMPEVALSSMTELSMVTPPNDEPPTNEPLMPLSKLAIVLFVRVIEPAPVTVLPLMSMPF